MGVTAAVTNPMTGPKTSELESFVMGVGRGQDPQPLVDAVDGEGRAVTSSSSSWNHQICTVCGHTFRRGDTVRIIRDPEYRVLHTAPELRCDTEQGDRAAQADTQTDTQTDQQEGTRTGDAERFAEGLLRAFPVAGGVPVHVLAPDDWRVARPGMVRPPTCLYCAHTFRPGEHVVVCPCSPLTARCGAAVHRHPAAGLNCWESWRPDSSLTVCPVTLERVEGTSA
jgi:hypothetical protein